MKLLGNMVFLRNFLIFLPAFIVAVSARIFIEVNFPIARHVNVEDGSFPAGEELRLIQISDIHSHPLPSRALMNRVASFKPIFIALTGDLINDTDIDYSVALRWVSELTKVAPVYFVPGNHELSSSDRGWEIINGIRDKGGIVLRNNSVTLGNPVITIAGLDDLSLGEPDLKKTISGASGYTILLSHSPLIAEKINREHGINLVLSGDTHGGQVRLPFLGPVYLPPRKGAKNLSKGLARLPSGAWIHVDSGYGTTEIPIRLFNRSQITFITVRNKN